MREREEDVIKERNPSQVLKLDRRLEEEGHE